MSRRALLGAAAAMTVGVLFVISLFLDRAPASPPSGPATRATAGATPPLGTQPTAAPTPATDTTAEGGPTPHPSTSPGGGDASPGSTPYSQTGEARQQWGPVVQGFAVSFTQTSGKSAAAWRTGLDRYVTVAVQKQLRTVDPRNVPNGSYATYEADNYNEEEVAAKVTYREGWALIVYVIHDGEKWRIYRYDRWEE